MLTTLAFVAALSIAPSQAGELQLTNVRPTYGVLGPKRTDNQIIPGDTFSIAFDIENLVTDKDGKVMYNMGMELTNPEGKTEYKRDPEERPLTIFNVLGGNRIPAFAHAQTGPDTAKGEYTLKVTVVDRAGKNRTQTLSQKFVVKEKSFGIVQLSTSYDDKLVFPSPAVGMAGQSIWINFWTVGFTLGQNKQPNVKFQMNVLDGQNQKTLASPIEGEVNKGVPPDTDKIPMQFLLPLNRVGKFTIELQATDENNKKTSKLTLPITVLEQ